MVISGFLPYSAQALWDTNISKSAADSRHSKIAWTGSGYGYVWQEQVGERFQIKFREANELGGLLAAPAVISDSTGSAFFPDIAWDGEKFAIVWQDDRDGVSELYLRFIKSGGEPTGPAVRLTYHNDFGSTRPAGEATMENFDIIEGQARRVDKAAGAFQPSIAWDGKELGIAFADARTTTAEIYFMIVRDGQKVSQETAVTQNHQNFTRPYMIWDGSAFVVTWENDVPGARQVLFARIDTTGRTVNYAGVINDTTHSARFPVVAWNGTDYVLVYENSQAPGSSLHIVRLDKRGHVISRVQLERNDEIAVGSRPFLVWAEDKFLLFWQDERFKKVQVFVTALDKTANKLWGDWLVVNSKASFEPRAVWNGTGAAFVWTDLRDQENASDKNSEVYFNLFDVWAPIISNLETIETRDRQVTLGWQTNELSDAEIRYDLGKDPGTGEMVQKVINDDNWVKDHELTIADLEPGVTYHFKLRARDVNDNRVIHEVVVTTLSYAPTTPPRQVVAPPTTNLATSSKPANLSSSYAYGLPRVKNLIEEHYRYLGLRRFLQSRLGQKRVDQISQAAWERYVKAVQYGGYPASTVLQEIKGGLRVSDTVSYQK